MTIATQQSEVTLLGNGSTTVFNFPFVADSASDISVTYTDINGVTGVLPKSEYILFINAVPAGNIWGVGGSVTYPTSGAPIEAGSSLTIQRVLPLTQTVSISNQGSFAPEVIEQALDVLEMQIQQISARGGQFRGVWVPGVKYNFGDFVIDGHNGNNTGNLYLCVLTNLSVSWPADLANGDWSLLFPAAIVPQSSGILTVATIGAMKAFPINATFLGQIIYAEGYFTAGDGGGGPFLVTTNNPGADNGGTIIHSATAGFYFTRQYSGPLEIKWFGAVGNGSTDDTEAFSAAFSVLSSARGGQMNLSADVPSSYLISAQLNVSSNVTLDGVGASISCTNYASVGNFNALLHVVSGSSNIEIRGLTINGNGTWNSTPFSNPYGGGNSVGFTNGLTGIWVDSGTSNVRVMGNSITGVENGIIASGTNHTITDNIIATAGNAAIQCQTLSYSTISGNKIAGVLGNITTAGDTSTADSKFADGIYVYTSNNLDISKNIITNCIRIGIVLEGDGVTLDHLVLIQGNVISNMNSCRGTELNAAIWFEDGHTDNTCSAHDNICNNAGATAGANSSIGIQISNGCPATGNTAMNFDIGVVGSDFTATANKISGNNFGVSVSTQIAGKITLLSANEISNNIQMGVDVQQSHGMIAISGNTMRDNGGSNTAGCAVRVSRYYNDQKVSITGNTFISSASAGDTTGQLYGVLSIAGGDFNNTSNFINGNQFFYTGTLAAYPSNIAVTPCGWGYDNTSDPVLAFDIVNDLFNNNNTSKMPQGQQPYASGQRYLGFLAAPPSSAMVGDWYDTATPTAGGSKEEICTTAPSTFKTTSAISS